MFLSCWAGRLISGEHQRTGIERLAKEEALDHEKDGEKNRYVVSNPVLVDKCDESTNCNDLAQINRL